MIKGENGSPPLMENEMRPVYGELSTNSWSTDPDVLLPAIITDCLQCEHSQSSTYYKNVSSIPFVLQQHANDPLSTATAMEELLVKMTTAYFATSEVSVTYVETGADSFELTCGVTVRDVDGEERSLNSTSVVENGAFKRVIEELNYG